MTAEPLRHLTHDLINKEKWFDILQHFIGVLRINIFIVDSDGKVILPPQGQRYAGEFLENKNLGFDLTSDKENFLNQFEPHGTYLEYHHPFDLHSFAIPMNIEDGKTIAYMIVGPVALNQKTDPTEIETISKKLNLGKHQVSEILNEIRVVSFITIKSILDLLSEVSKYVIQLSFQGQKFHKMRFNKEVLPPQVSEAAHDIYSSICLDELLVTLLDVALSMTKVECGSIMILDKAKGNLTIKVSRGIDTEWAKKAQIKVGEGVAGLAVKENTSFVIRGTSGDNRIKHLLKRPEIKQALVMPLFTDNNVFGVLNLHTKVEGNDMTEESLNVVQNLSKLTSAAINSIQQQTFPAS